jgi:hypothetical protein
MKTGQRFPNIPGEIVQEFVQGEPRGDQRIGCERGNKEAVIGPENRNRL